MENQYLNLDPGRRYYAHSAVLAAEKQSGAFFKELLLENLSKNRIFTEYLSRHLGKHLKLLQG